MARYDRESIRRERRNLNSVPRDYDIDYGYRRGGFMGSQGAGMAGPGHRSYGRMSTGGVRGGGMGAGRFGAGGPYQAYGKGEMGVTLGNDRGMSGNFGGGGANRGSRGAYLGGPSARRGAMGGRGMRYDIGYGMGNDRDWF
jgi:hypothetical protein